MNDPILSFFDRELPLPEAGPEFTRPTQDATRGLVLQRIGDQAFREEGNQFVLPPEDIGQIESYGIGLVSNGIAMGGASWVNTKFSDAPDNTEAPGFNFSVEAEVDDRFASRLNHIMGVQTEDPAANRTLLALQGAKNREYADYLLNRYDEAVAWRKRLEDAPLLGYSLGMLTSFGIDFGLALALTGGTSAPAVFARGIAEGGALVAKGSQAAQRAYAAARLSSILMAEGATERLVQQLTDLNVTDDDIWIAGGFGALIGTGLGAAFPRALGNVFTRADVQAATQSHQEMLAGIRAAEKAHADSVGAAATPIHGDTIIEDIPGKGAGTLGVTQKIGETPGFRWMDRWRNPKNWLRTDMGVAGQKLADEEGLTGARNYWRVFQHIYKSAVATAGEIQGNRARELALSESIRKMSDDVIVRETQVARDYAAMAKEVYGVGTVKRNMINDTLFSSVTPTAMRRQLGGTLPTLEEFNYQADILARIRADNPERVEEFLSTLVERLDVPADKRSAFVAALTKTANDDDAFYKAWADRGAAMGLLNPDEIKPGYRPQMWNRAELLADKTGFINEMSIVLGAQPTEEFANRFFSRMIAEELGHDVEEGAVKNLIDVEAGETVASLKDKHPEVYRRVVQAWEEAAKDKLVEAADEAAFITKQRLKQAGEKSLSTMRERTQRLTTAAKSRKAKLESELEAMPVRWVRKRSDKADEIGQLELDIEKLEGRLRRVEEAFGNEERIRALIRKEGSAAEKRLIKDALKKFTADEKKAMRAFAKDHVAKAAEEIYETLIDQKSAFGLVPDQLISQSKHFRHRTINLAGHEDTPNGIGRFLIKDARHARNQYVLSYGRQTAIREHFMPILERAGVTERGVNDREFLTRLKEFAMKDFEEDRVKLDARKAQGENVSKLRARVDDDARQASEFFDRAFGEITRSDYLGQTGEMLHFVNTAQAATAASVLGQVLASLFGDTAMMTLGGGKMATGWRSFFTPMRSRAIFKELAKDDTHVELILRGPAVFDQSLFVARADLDNPGFDLAGGKWAKVSRVTADVATKEGWFNFMHPWNRHLRGSFGVDFAVDILRDLKQFGKMDESLRTFYARHGVGKAEAKKLVDALETHGRRISGDLVVPHTKRWAELGLQEEYDTWRRLIQGAGDEAMIDPQIGDRPFLRHHAAGRLVLQFQSFMFTAAERFFAPLWQNGLLDGGATRSLASLLFGLGLSAMGEGLRAYNRGEGDEWARSWNTGQGLFNNLKAAYLRSPFVYGMTGTAGDILGVYAGPHINDAFQAITGSGFQPIDERWTKFRQGQDVLGFVPALGTLNSIRKFGMEAIEGDTDALAKLSKSRLPFYNGLPLHVTSRILNNTVDVPTLPGNED